MHASHNLPGGHSLRRAASIVVLAMALTVAMCATAMAGTITGTNPNYTYTATAGEQNSIVQTSVSATSITLVDSTATLNESSSSCTKAGSVVTCTISADGSSKFAVNLGDGNDGFAGDSAAVVRDTVNFGSGVFESVSCGGGIDIASFSGVATPVRVTPNSGTSDDGPIGSNDWVSPTCEGSTGGTGADYLVAETHPSAGQITGGDGNDLIFGSSANSSTACGSNASDLRLDGGNGNDVITAYQGANYVTAGLGDDVINGGVDCDRIYDNTGNDVVIGGAGDDWIEAAGDVGYSNVKIGGAGFDDIRDSAGNDVIIANDGEADSFRCYVGTGNNRVVADNDTLDQFDPTDGSEADCDVLTRVN